jgi:hypothetical protein
MKRQSTLNKEAMVKQLNWLERKNKRNTSWDTQVKMAFAISSSFSFDELVIKDTEVAQALILNFKD